MLCYNLLQMALLPKNTYEYIKQSFQTNNTLVFILKNIYGKLYWACAQLEFMSAKIECCIYSAVLEYILDVVRNLCWKFQYKECSISSNAKWKKRTLDRKTKRITMTRTYIAVLSTNKYESLNVNCSIIYKDV